MAEICQYRGGDAEAAVWDEGQSGQVAAGESKRKPSRGSIGSAKGNTWKLVDLD